MPAFDAQYQFAAAFTVFLVALAGVALVALRADPLTTRPAARAALGLGFVGIGSAAFLSGSLLVEDPAALLLLALRLGGAACLVAGSLHWRGSALSRTLLWLGTAGVVVGGLIERADLPSAAAVVGAVGGLLIGGSLLSASRRAIAARIAASAAATLLLVVLVLSVALSAVLANTVEDQALGALDGRALQEASAIESRGREAIKDAEVAAALLSRLTEDPANSSSPRVLARLDENVGATANQRAAIENQLNQLSTSVFSGVAFSFVDRRGRIVAAGGLEQSTFVTVAGSESVTEALAVGRGRATVQVFGSEALAVGVSPLNLRQGQEERLLGAVVAAVPIDLNYLTVRSRDGDRVSLALLSASGVVGQAGSQPPLPMLKRVASGVLGPRAGAAQASAVTDDRFLAARPVRAADNRPVVALVASRPTTAVENVRKSLFRTFFVIAFGGTVLALLLAALVGDRIGAGIRRLTITAEAIQQGRLGVRSGLQSRDEIGVLGATFDSMASSIQDKTEALRRAADEEAQLRSRVEAIVAGMGEALVAFDAQGRITDFNAAAEELLRIEAASARGRPVEDVVLVRSEQGADLGPRLRYAEPRWSTLATVRAAHDSVPVALTAGALRGPDGKVAGGVIVLRDLRGEREVERMKRHFLSRVGHELRTPLTPLIGYTQLLAARDLPPERARPLYQSMLSAARRLQRIVEMLEFFASLDAGREVLQPVRVDLRQLLNSVVEERLAKANGAHQITRRISRATPAVMADARWLARSVDELVDNAMKFSPAGGRVTVSAGASTTDPDMVEISVRDTGVGMSSKEVEQAFAEWAQGDESDTRSYGGLGLGLALVQRVAERHGGRVTCSTAPGKGSRFSILLPALAEPDGHTGLSVPL